MTDYSPSDLAYMDRFTVPYPAKKPSAPQPVEPTVHPLAGRTPGVRATSRKALASIKGELGPKQAELLRAIQQSKRPINDRELTGFLGWPISSINGRRNELVEMGKVEEAFRAVDPKTGKRVIYWRAVEAQG